MIFRRDIGHQVRRAPHGAQLQARRRAAGGSVWPVGGPSSASKRSYWLSPHWW
jgi:hypothetical protein